MIYKSQFQKIYTYDWFMTVMMTKLEMIHLTSSLEGAVEFII